MKREHFDEYGWGPSALVHRRWIVPTLLCLLFSGLPKLQQFINDKVLVSIAHVIPRQNQKCPNRFPSSSRFKSNAFHYARRDDRKMLPSSILELLGFQGILWTARYWAQVFLQDIWRPVSRAARCSGTAWRGQYWGSEYCSLPTPYISHRIA